MTTRSVLLALLAMWGVGTTCSSPALAEDATESSDADASADEDTEASLTDRVWVRSDQGDLPGVMQVFLGDGTLVSDSCWETYRLSNWEWVVDGKTLRWTEDGMAISAEVRLLTPTRLVLSLDVGGGLEQTFDAAGVPFVCPDMPR